MDGAFRDDAFFCPVGDHAAHAAIRFVRDGLDVSFRPFYFFLQVHCCLTKRAVFEAWLTRLLRIERLH